jgi:hypothetical protein
MDAAATEAAINAAFEPLLNHLWWMSFWFAASAVAMFVGNIGTWLSGKRYGDSGTPTLAFHYVRATGLLLAVGTYAYFVIPLRFL